VPEAFPIFRSVEILPGMYRESRGGITGGSKVGRRLSGTLSFSAGGFYGGSRTELSPEITWKANKNVTLSGAWVNNWIDLPQDAFRIQLIRGRVGFSLNPQFYISSIVQYDNDSRRLGVNLRAGYLFQEGRELILVYNDISDRFDVPGLRQESTKSLALKFTYLFGL
jgi:hypothetical protein